MVRLFQTFAQRFTKKRNEEGFSFKKLSEATRISTSVLYAYSKGTSYPEGEHLLNVCKVLKLNPVKEKEKIQVEKINKVFTIAQYPNFRKIVLDFYAQEYSELSEHPISKEQISEEFGEVPLHHFEEIIRDVVNHKLRASKGYPSDFSIENWKSNENEKFTEVEQRKIVQSVLTDWGLVSSGKILIMSFVNSKGIRDTERYKMETKIKWKKE